MSRVKSFFADESGIETLEYAILAGLIVSGTVVIILAISVWVKNRYIDLDAVLV